MKVTVLRNTLIFDEVFNELATVKDLHTYHEKLCELGINEPVTLDFAQVPYANSSGVMVLLLFLQEVKTQFKYRNAPPWLVKQFSMINGYFANESYVESLQGQFYAPHTRDVRTVMLTLGKEVPILPDYSNFNISPMTIDGKVWEMDFSPVKYFQFICDNFELFKRQIK